tara:strand:+ start:346 stop:714 length:369 start_codon:yes stop_codon:yes gene_type:complete
MNSLIYDFNQSNVRKGDQTLSAGIKPVFSFDYDSLNYSSVTTASSTYQIENADYDLTDEQCAEIEEYISGVTPDPTETTNFQSKMYLAETDWYVIRKTETGTAIPTDILVARADARAAITTE